MASLSPFISIRKPSSVSMILNSLITFSIVPCLLSIRLHCRSPPNACDHTLLHPADHERYHDRRERQNHDHSPK
jgi:hypothetical protein